MPKLRSPIPYHGGKTFLADWIISRMPKHSVYVEPFFGGGSVLFRKPYIGTSEIVNDIDQNLTTFWRVLQKEDDFRKFKRIIEAVPISKVEWKDALRRSRSEDPVERAVGFFIKIRQGRQGLVYKDTSFSMTRKTTKNGMCEEASKWWSAIDGLDEIRDRLRRVRIHNDDAVDLIHREDKPYTLFYCDPPYTRTSRNGDVGSYGHEMTDRDHIRLLRCLGNIKGKFLLSGYTSKMYLDAAKHYGWRCYRKIVAKHSSNLKVKPTAIEHLWYNF